MFLDWLRPTPFHDLDLVSNQVFGSLKHLEVLFDKPLAEILTDLGINRAVDVGSGKKFTTIKQLARLSLNSVPIFTRDNLLALDPILLSDSELIIELGTYADKFLREPASVEQLSEAVLNEYTPPFGLIYSRGVVSIGWYGDFDKRQQEIMAQISGTLTAMRDCMDSENPNSLLMLESVNDNETLLVTRDQLAELGLEIVFYINSVTTVKKDWVYRLREKGIFPQNPEDAGYRFIIAQPES